MSNPTPTNMKTITRKRSYQLSRLDLQSLNYILINIAQRLDQLEGIGQNPDLHGKVIKNLGPGVEDTDSARIDQL